ncbi:MAG TPA: class I SAM-dependent methyltransferase [Vicinamibacterales bacterium]|nr:class I SAM-dependent methyltransferase [Vicinamibacterales bacterium]
MERVLEPELMEDELQSIAYARADFSTSNQLFVDGLIHDFPQRMRTAVDIGCGPGDVMIRLARALPDLEVVAIDGSAPMITLARAAVLGAGLGDRISLLQGHVPGVALDAHSFDAVLSKDLLHHVPNPSLLWKEIARLARPGAVVYVMDLVRPETREDAARIVDRVAAREDPVLREDFFNSLCAAFTVDELREQVAGAGLRLEVRHVSDRHALVSGLI